MEYGLTIENHKYIQEKAAGKVDGVYQARGVGYRVRSGRVTHFSSNGQILEFVFGFNCVVGSYDGCNANGVKLLKSIK